MEAAEQWEPDDARVSRPVLGERGDATARATRLFIRINGALHYLWRDVDQNGVVLDILVQGRRNAEAAKRFFKRLLRDSNSSRAAWSPTACAATARPVALSCRMSGTGRAGG